MELLLPLLPLVWAPLLGLWGGLCAAAAERHTVFWNSSNPKFQWSDYAVEVHLNDYLDIICPHYEDRNTPAQTMERYTLYLVEREEYETCKPHSKDQIRWECNRPDSLYGPERFSEKFQRFTPFTLGKEFREGHEYYYISKPIHRHTETCLKLKVMVAGKSTVTRDLFSTLFSWQSLREPCQGGQERCSSCGEALIDRSRGRDQRNSYCGSEVRRYPAMIPPQRGGFSQTTPMPPCCGAWARTRPPGRAAPSPSSASWSRCFCGTDSDAPRLGRAVRTDGDAEVRRVALTTPPREAVDQSVLGGAEPQDPPAGRPWRREGRAWRLTVDLTAGSRRGALVEVKRGTPQTGWTGRERPGGNPVRVSFPVREPDSREGHGQTRLRFPIPKDTAVIILPGPGAAPAAKHVPWDMPRCWNTWAPEWCQAHCDTESLCRAIYL